MFKYDKVQLKHTLFLMLYIQQMNIEYNRKKWNAECIKKVMKHILKQ